MTASVTGSSTTIGTSVLDMRNVVIRAGVRPETSIVDIPSFTISTGETVGLVGESGSGKSLTCRAAMGLMPPSLTTTGSILLDGDDLESMSPARQRAVRGTTAAMIFQEPMSSLNPVLTVGAQLTEALKHGGVSGRKAVHASGLELLGQVGIGQPERRWRQFPHELSGGMCQRVMIAIALAGDPRLLIADEPTTALDVTIQAQIIELINSLVAELRMSLLLVTHDLGVVTQTCRRICVMYGGRIVETGETAEVLAAPQHPYTEALLESLPDIDAPLERLQPIRGSVPAVDAMPSGCRFHPRCPLAVDRCRAEVPPMIELESNRSLACWVRGA